MLKILRIILSIITIGLSGFSLITQNFEYTPYLMLSLGATMLVMGLIELKKTKKNFGDISVLLYPYLFFMLP